MIVVEDNSLWQRVLKARYGDLKHHILLEKYSFRKSASSWQKDLLKIGTITTNLGICFAGLINYKHGDGNSVPFQAANWYGSSPIAISFHDLFLISRREEEHLANIGTWVNGSWTWGDFGIQPATNGDVLIRLQNLKNLLVAFTRSERSKDILLWKNRESVSFNVKEVYQLMMNTRTQELISTDQKSAFKCLWKVKAHAKVLMFDGELFGIGWQQMINCLKEVCAILVELVFTVITKMKPCTIFFLLALFLLWFGIVWDIGLVVRRFMQVVVGSSFRSGVVWETVKLDPFSWPPFGCQLFGASGGLEMRQFLVMVNVV